MVTDEKLRLEVALSIIELIDNFDSVEGMLLQAAGADQTITNGDVEAVAKLSPSRAKDLLRQLNRADAVQLSKSGNSYTVQSRQTRKLFTVVRQAASTLETHQSRTPSATDVTPVITLPDDPDFRGTSPQLFGMSHLMPSLSRLIKQAEDRIVLLSPFLEADGIERLHLPLKNALKRGVQVTIVTRYLADEESYNYSVLANLCETLEEDANPNEKIQFVDYTVWDGDVPADEQVQDGRAPSFTFHAKVLLSDDSRVYVGSANLTDYGFDRYLELGVILEGPTVSSFTDLIGYLLDSEAATVVRPSAL
ncbi:phospholipase D-like domain-containing protein [Haloferax sp. DFSO60]|uniref:phospholipase D-like domain-containing protein n=1 Tax=Haloferax sp. DFSO60 TaxID=3388652 RepID=UPI00397AF466